MQKIQINLNEIMSVSCNEDFWDKPQDNLISMQLDIFDHCLTPEEAYELMLSYPVLKRKKSDMTKYYEKEKLILSFFMSLYEKYQIVLCREKDHFTFDNKKEFKKACTQSIREINFIDLHIPEIDLTILGNFDMNMPMFFSAKNLIGISIVQKELEKYKKIYLLGPFSNGKLINK